MVVVMLLVVVEFVLVVCTVIGAAEPSGSRMSVYVQPPACPSVRGRRTWRVKCCRVPTTPITADFGVTLTSRNRETPLKPGACPNAVPSARENFLPLIEITAPVSGADGCFVEPPVP